MSNIKVNNTKTYPSGSNFDAKATYASSGGSVTLTSDSGADINVYTWPSDAFGSPCPYSATKGGKAYILKSGLSGMITLDLSDSQGLGTNGTINVGGGGNPCDGGDNDDDHHHRSHSRA